MKIKLRQTTAMARRSFLKSAGLAALGAALGSKAGQALLAALPDDPDAEGRRLVRDVVHIGVDVGKDFVTAIVMRWNDAEQRHEVIGEVKRAAIDAWHQVEMVDTIIEANECDREGHVHPAEGFGGGVAGEPYECVRCGTGIA